MCQPAVEVRSVVGVYSRRKRQERGSSPEIPSLRSCYLGFKGRGKLPVEVREGEYPKCGKGHKAHTYDMKDVPRRMLLGTILGLAVEV